jgi:hypothetical protein
MGHPSSFVWSPHGIEPLAPEVLPEPIPAPSASAEEDPGDQRHFPRLDLKLPVLYRVVDGRSVGAAPSPAPGAPSSRSGHSDNISPTGACLLLAESLPQGTQVALTIHLEVTGEKISALGRVVWVKTTDNPAHFLTGLRFISVYKKTFTNVEYLDPEYLAGLLRDA